MKEVRDQKIQGVDLIRLIRRTALYNRACTYWLSLDKAFRYTLKNFVHFFCYGLCTFVNILN